jgi:hypothetical protein
VCSTSGGGRHRAPGVTRGKRASALAPLYIFTPAEQQQQHYWCVLCERVCGERWYDDGDDDVLQQKRASAAT